MRESYHWTCLIDGDTEEHGDEMKRLAARDAW